MVEVVVSQFMGMRQLSGRDSDQGRNSSSAFVVALGSSVNRCQVLEGLETDLLGRLADADGCGTCLGSPRSDAEQAVLTSEDKRLDEQL